MKKRVENLVDYLNSTLHINQEISIPTEYTLVMRPHRELLHKLTSFISNLSVCDPSHRYYTEQNLHATVYGAIDINTDIDSLHSFLIDLLKETELIFRVSGASTTAIILDPVDFSLL